jgi:hypothetical protein
MYGSEDCIFMVASRRGNFCCDEYRREEIATMIVKPVGVG